MKVDVAPFDDAQAGEVGLAEELSRAIHYAGDEETEAAALVIAPEVEIDGALEVSVRLPAEPPRVSPTSVPPVPT